ncbi:MAG: hypothetical protein U0132_15330 [Gemmatimonadaceae bacterium]
MPTPSVSKLTPVLVVTAIEPSLEFWEKRLGFSRTVEVPHENALGFVILVKDGVELMFQSAASVLADLGSSAGGESAALFIEVGDLAAIEQALAGYPLTMPRRTTFYGMHEIGVKEPGGHFVVFAQPTQ